MNTLTGVAQADRQRALWLSTLSPSPSASRSGRSSRSSASRSRTELGLSETQFGILVATPILTGSLTRLMLGIWTEQYGGRIVFPAADAARRGRDLAADLRPRPIRCSWSPRSASVSPAGRSRSAWPTSRRWFPQERQGTALGIFGAGNVGAAVTKFVAPFVMVAFGWEAVAQVWAIALGGDGRDLLRCSPRTTRCSSSVARAAPAADERRPAARAAAEPAGLALLALLLLRVRRLRGAGAVAAALPRRASTASTSAPPAWRRRHSRLAASLFRAYGGHLSDRFGARTVMYWTFGFSMVLLFMLSLSADRLRDPRRRRADRLLDRDGRCAVRRSRSSCSASS